AAMQQSFRNRTSAGTCRPVTGAPFTGVSFYQPPSRIWPENDRRALLRSAEICEHAGNSFGRNPQSGDEHIQFKALIASTSIVGALAWMPLVSAQAQSAPALGGQVSSAEEGAMEGVLVSAKKAGSTITVTVVTDAKGRYSFPADRLDAGHYAITIR